jgi:hypothetical protein
VIELHILWEASLIIVGKLEDILLMATSHQDDAIRYDCLQVICSVKRVSEPILDIELDIIYAWLISNLKVCNFLSGELSLSHL